MWLILSVMGGEGQRWAGRAWAGRGGAEMGGEEYIGHAPPPGIRFSGSTRRCCPSVVELQCVYVHTVLCVCVCVCPCPAHRERYAFRMALVGVGSCHGMARCWRCPQHSSAVCWCHASLCLSQMCGWSSTPDLTPHTTPSVV